jgi:hypothetical protein
MPGNKGLLTGTAFLSASMLLLELVLIRLFSIVLFSDYAVLGISIALFGLTIGGILVYAASHHFRPEILERKLFAASVFLCVSLLVLPPLLASINFAAVPQQLRPPIFVLISVPFIIGNVCLSLLFKRMGASASRLYFFDLAGAAVGCVAAIVLMSLVSLMTAFFTATVLAAAAAAAFAASRRQRAAAAVMLLVGLAAVIVNQRTDLVHVSFNKMGKESGVLFAASNSYSRVTVNSSSPEWVLDSLPAGPDKDPGFETLGIRIDSHAFTPIIPLKGDVDELPVMRRDLSSLANLLRPNGTSLIIGPGGGKDVIMALQHGSKVRAVEINPIIANDVMRGKFLDFSGRLYERPDVDLRVAEGRSFIGRDASRYDVINLPLVDTWAATAQGSLFLVENHLYTVEAFEDYLRHVRGGGILTVTRWDFDGLRLITLFLEASRRLDIADPARNVTVVANRTNDGILLNNYLFSDRPFTEDDLGRVETFAKDNGFIPVYLPGRELGTEHEAYLRSPDPARFQANYASDIRPVTDDRPFFFFVTKFHDLLSLRSVGLTSRLAGAGISFVFFDIVLLAALSIIVPLLILPRPKTPGRRLAGALSYFSVLAMAFMFVEIAQVQKFVLFLEHPIYSYSVVLAAILLFAGIGSMISSRIGPSTRNFFLVAGAAAIGCLGSLALNRITAGFLYLPILSKVVWAAAATAPSAIFMGMMLPLGIRRLSAEKADELIPWAWAVNGAVSVLASVLALFVAIASGFTSLLLTGAALYLSAPFFMLPSRASAETRAGGRP